MSEKKPDLPLSKIDEALALEDEVIELRIATRARRGDPRALEAYTARMARRARASVDLGELNSVADMNRALMQLTNAAARGDISTYEAAGLASIIKARITAYVNVELEERLNECQGKVDEAFRSLGKTRRVGGGRR